MNKKEERYMWLALGVVIVGTFMSILDSSIVNVAIPKMMTIFGASTDQIEWVITGYMLTMSIIIPLTGYLGDRFGLKKLYIFALSVFTVGSALCGLSTSTDTMIAARVVQAIGGGMIMPVGMAMIYQIVPLEKRGLALGVWGIAAMAAPAIGPTLSGYIVQYMDWRLIFTINIPVGIIGVTLAIIMLKETEIKDDKKFDFLGAITSATGLFALLLGLSEGNSKGWTSGYEIVLFIIAIISLSAFVYIELNIEEPLLNLRILKIFPFTLSLLISAITTIGMYGALFLLPIYIQNVRGYTPMQSGIISLPSAIVTGIMMPISGRIFDRFGAKWITVVGTIILAGASFALSKLSLDTGYTTIVIIMMFRGLGMGMAMMPAQTSGMNSVPRELSGRATALSNTVRQVSGSFGIAILTTVLQRRETFHAVRFSEGLNLNSPAMINAQKIFAGTAVQHGLSQVAAKSAFLAQIYTSLMQQAAIAGINDSLLIATFICLAGIPLAFFIRDAKKKPIDDSEMFNKAK
jgi:DHA2 family multidrug resistance protein